MDGWVSVWMGGSECLVDWIVTWCLVDSVYIQYSTCSVVSDWTCVLLCHVYGYAIANHTFLSFPL